MTAVARLAPLGERCHAIATGHVAGKAGLVVGDRRSLLVDAGASAIEGAAILAAATIDRPPELVVLTHGHWDHVRGGVSLPGLDVIAHADAVPGVADQLLLEDPSGANDRSGRPTIVASGGLTLDLGAVVVELIVTPGHAPGSWCAWVPAAGVLYAGDTVVTAIPPVFSDGDSVTLERTLRSLAHLPIRVLVPGHGSVVVGEDAVRRAILARAGYLAWIRDVARARFGPDGIDGVVAALPLEAVDPAALDMEAIPVEEQRTRHERAVHAIVAELGLRPPA